MDQIQTLLQRTQEQSVHIRTMSNSARQALVLKIADLLSENIPLILSENQKDLDRMEDTNPKKDRLLLNEERVLGLVQSLREVAALEDPTCKELFRHQTEGGLVIVKKTVPLGVVGVIYEARPNVTIDVAALCLRSGNAAVLRGGSDAEATNRVLVGIIHQALESMGLPKESICLLPVDRKHVQELLEAVRYVDIIIPRGSQELIDFVRTHAKVPTIETGAGVCHTYVEQSADLDMAARIVVNAKTHRPSVCNSLDTILVDVAIAKQFLPRIIPGFLPFEVEVFADEPSYAILAAHAYPFLQKAEENHYGCEFLSQKCSVKVVLGIDEAMQHIAKYSSKHSEAIVTQNDTLATLFMNTIDAAAVYVNASTRFTDGGVFGLGAEIGISTQKLHARGPFALEKLTTEKWFCYGNGQIR
jgi:glutamate-5-semialdehyde dehydrogenase